MLLLYLLSSRLSRFFGYCRSGSYTLSARRLADYTAGTEFHRSHKDILYLYDMLNGIDLPRSGNAAAGLYRLSTLLKQRWNAKFI